MESESEDFVVNDVKRGFFEGLSVAPKLNQKEKMLRQSIQENSLLETKQTTLQEKIERRENSFQNNIELDPEMFREKVIVEQQDKSQMKKKKGQPTFHITKDSQTKDKSFEDLRLIRPLLKAIGDLGYIKPTPIQQLAVPVISTGKDVVASSITGSGKTAAFLIPIIQRYYNVAAVGYIRSLVVTPTRQLAIQIYEQFEKLNKYTKLDAVLVIGASSIQKQEQCLRNNPEVVIGTPGRIIDLLMNSRSIGIENLEILIFDEADKLLELGFENEIKEIMKHCNQEVQTVMFSATMGKDIERLATVTTRKPIRLSADPDNKTAEKLHQQVVRIKEDTEEYREAVLISVLTQLYKERTIVFFKTKKMCHRMAIILGLLGLKACELHGNLSQTQRIQAFNDFKEDKFNFLLATDLASRGLDIKEVKTVINFELPTHLTKYIHRIGRTARAGSVGTSLTICNDSECLELKRMSKKTGDKLFKLNVNDEAVKKFQQTILGLYREIGAILTEERQEQVMRKADMELKKLENMTDHKQEIYSRPKKEWFVSEKEKRMIQEKAQVETGQTIEQPFKTKKIRKNKEGGNRGGDRGNREQREDRGNFGADGEPKKRGNFGGNSRGKGKFNKGGANKGPRGQRTDSNPKGRWQNSRNGKRANKE